MNLLLQYQQQNLRMEMQRNGSKSSGSLHHEPEKAHANRVQMDNIMSGRMWEPGGSFTRTLPVDDDRSDKILEVDTGNPRVASKHRSPFYSSHLSLGSDQKCPSYFKSKDSTARQSIWRLSYGEVQSLSPLKFAEDVDDSTFSARFGMEIWMQVRDNDEFLYSGVLLRNFSLWLFLCSDAFSAVICIIHGKNARLC